MPWPSPETCLRSLQGWVGQPSPANPCWSQGWSLAWRVATSPRVLLLLTPLLVEQQGLGGPTGDPTHPSKDLNDPLAWHSGTTLCHGAKSRGCRMGLSPPAAAGQTKQSLSQLLALSQGQEPQG